ncbi:MAG: hypothetical protein WDM80_08725 [Limisphaerales bacterium]
MDGYSPFAIPKSVLNELFIRSGYLLAIVAGLLLAAAFPNIGIAGFAWIAPALILLRHRQKNLVMLFASATLPEFRSGWHRSAGCC